ncbi:flagellin [Candidatus Bathyarchaeota archaeon]|nr:MAG: flagellin [Candidatus Bathyarchaeota archaeon]
MKMMNRKDVGAIGIGAMIVFIAMVLVAGIAASVLIQTSSRLESQAMATGEQTTAEVATGIAVANVEGHVSSGSIDKLAISVRPRAGSKDIDLSTVVLELSNSTTKCVLTYDNTQFASTPAAAGLFSTNTFSLSAGEFGIIVLEDADSSCKSSTPVINRGDKVVLTVNATATFGGIGVRTDIWGRVVPEEGAPGMISFRTPASLTDTIYMLQ